MGFWNLLKFSTRMFKARTSRTVLTILGMSVGIGAILFLVALGFGIQKTLLETITTADSLLTLDVYPGEAKPAISRADINNIKKIPGVDFISPVFETAGRLKYGGLVTEAKIIAVDEKFLDLEGLKITEGRKINDKNLDGVIISSALAKVFEKAPDAMLGEIIKIAFNQTNSDSAEPGEGDFKIIGSVDKKEIIIYINQKFLNSFSPVSAFSKLKVKSVSSQAMSSLRTWISEGGFIVSAVTDIIDQVEKVFQVIRIILGLFGAVALIVSAIGMFNTMVVTLLERTEEIGVMKSIGASDHDILWMFVFESTIMGFLGGVVGVALGLSGGAAFNLLFNFLAQKMGGYSTAIFYFPGWFLLFILTVATLVGFFTGLIPARKASRTDPLEALRYK
ncbi:MAG: ABC transporter permease [bacterium]|nr:ABC transporter permease [bacterium]